MIIFVALQKQKKIMEKKKKMTKKEWNEYVETFHRKLTALNSALTTLVCVAFFGFVTFCLYANRQPMGPPSPFTIVVHDTIPISKLNLKGSKYGWEPLYHAIAHVESRHDPKATNNGALGILQIRKCMVQDYNRLTGENISHDQVYNPRIARKIFYKIASIYGNDSYEKLARIWNRGPRAEIKGTAEYNKTTNYWKKVAQNIEI